MTADDRTVAETEARLRRALAARAEAVEPAAGPDTLPALATRAEAARRRAVRQRTLLSVAAVTVVVAAVAVGLVLTGGDRDDLDVAGTTTSIGSTTTSRGAVVLVPDFDAPAIWPLPGMSIRYDSPESAATAFWSGYLGFAVDGCLVPAVVDGARAVAGICSLEGQRVFVRDEGAHGWVVVGAETDVFDLSSPTALSSHRGTFPIGLSTSTPVEVTLRPHGTIQVRVREEYGPGDIDAELAPDDGAPGTYVVAAVAADGRGATVRVAHLTDVDATTTTTEATTTTVAPTTTTRPDDGRPGWPAGGARRFDAAGDAALAFAEQVLGFADPTTVTSSGGDTDVTVDIRPRPTAGVVTSVAVHFTGARGWVVTGATSDQGTIDEVQGRTVRGVATAFEGTVTVRVLDLDGAVLDETHTQAGSNGELGPYEATLHVDRPGGPHFVLVGEGDASGEGDLNWASVTLLGS